MKTILFIAAVSFATAGCAKKGGDCDKAISNSMEVSKADLKKPGVDDKAMAKMRDLGVQHCKDDKWSEDAVKCMSDAKTEPDARGCYGKLTPDQRQAMQKAIMETAPAPAAAADGSSAPAAGSAAAGSAAAPQ